MIAHLPFTQLTRYTCHREFVKKNDYRTIYEHDVGVSKASRYASGERGDLGKKLDAGNTMVTGGSRCVDLDADDIKAAELLTLIWRGNSDTGSGARSLHLDSALELGKKRDRGSGSKKEKKTTGKKKGKASAQPRKRGKLADREALEIP